MDASVDYYATLRVTRGADAAALRRAYRDLMRRHHPDVNADPDCEDRCRAINEAYACLRDPERRAAYDGRWQPRFRDPPPGEDPATRPFPADWQSAFIAEVDEDMARQRKWSRLFALGLGIAVTIITFTLTSAVDRGPARSADDSVMSIDMKAAPPS